MTSPPLPWVSVVIPIKDERDNLPPLTEKLLKVLDGQKESKASPFEILYVDDGSTDGSAELLDTLEGRYPTKITVLHFDRNYGKTAALDAGMRHSRGALVITMDGDLQMDPEDIPKLLSHAKDYDLVCGWRQQRHDNLMRMLSSRLAFLVRNAVLKDGIHDTACEFKVFRRVVIDRLALFEGLHRFFPALALMHGFRVTEVPIRHHPRAHGQSKYGVGNRLFTGLYDMFAVRWMRSRVLRYRFLTGERLVARGEGEKEKW